MSKQETPLPDVKVGQRVILVIARTDYPARVKSVTLSSTGAAVSFAAQIIGSGRAPVRARVKEVGATWRVAS